MHIHSAQANALGNTLAAAQNAETAMSLRRARELRDAAVRLKAASLDMSSNLHSELSTDPETAAQTVSMVTAWTGGESASGQSSSSRQERFATDAQPQNAPAQIRPTQQVQHAPPSNPVSYWA